MNLDPVRKLAESILYQGLASVPEHRPEPAERRRWSFGSIYPRGYTLWTANGTLHAQQTQCLVDGPADATIEACLRFLQPVADAHPGHEPPMAFEREVRLGPASLAALDAAPVRRSFTFDCVRGALSIRAQRLDDGCHRITVRADNLSPFDPVRGWDERTAALHSMAVAHTVISVTGGRLVSLIDPPAPFERAAAQCVNRGCFPVLVGDRGAQDMLLASPMILHDYPEPVAVRSTPPAPACKRRRRLKVGDRVRLRPGRRSDTGIMPLAGRTATVDAIERDWSDRLQVGVTVDNEVAGAVGGFVPTGHYFLSPDEVEPLEPGR